MTRAGLLSLALLAGCAGGSTAVPSAGAGIAPPAGPRAPAPSPSPAATGVPGGGSQATPAPSAAPGASGAAAALAPSGRATYSDANGSLAYDYFVPAGGHGPYPLLLALHGCLESTAAFEAGARWFEDAQANGYAVVMPQHVVTPVTDPNGCWQYWNNHYRGAGEPALLVGLLADFATRVRIDPNRVYVAGLSSGGAMTTALEADYPDVFAAAAVGSGTEYQPCATDDIYQCYLALTVQTFDQDPVASGKAAYAQGRAASVRAVPTILLQGDADTVVAPFNLGQALTSIAVMNDGLSSSGSFPGAWTTSASAHDAGQVPGGYAYDHYAADAGRLDWTVVHGMNHAWSGGVANAASNASDGNNYNDPKGPSETLLFRSFLLRYSRTSP